MKSLEQPCSWKTLAHLKSTYTPEFDLGWYALHHCSEEVHTAILNRTFLNICLNDKTDVKRSRHLLNIISTA